MSLFRRIKNKLFPKPYFLVIGAGRGGTSLLAAMLDCHSQLQLGFERFSFDYLLGKKLSGPDTGNLNTRIGNFQKSCQQVADASSHYWGNKITTEQIAALEECQHATWPDYLDRFTREVIGKNKVVFIVRDGRACVQSKMKRTEQDYATALHRWKTSVAIMELLEAQGVDLHVCRYEDLVQHPEEELRKVAGFLGVKYERSMLEGPTHPKMPAMYRGSGIRQTAGHGDWQESWTADMYSELKKLGYIGES